MVAFLPVIAVSSSCHAVQCSGGVTCILPGKGVGQGSSSAYYPLHDLTYEMAKIVVGLSRALPFVDVEGARKFVT